MEWIGRERVADGDIQSMGGQYCTKDMLQNMDNATIKKNMRTHRGARTHSEGYKDMGWANSSWTDEGTRKERSRRRRMGEMGRW